MGERPQHERRISWEPRLNSAPPFSENSVTERLLKGDAINHIDVSRQSKTGMALGLAWACYAARFDDPDFARDLDDENDDSLSRSIPFYDDLPARDPWHISLPTPSGASPQDAPRSARDYHELYVSGKATPADVIDSILSLIKWDKSFKGEHANVFLFPQEDLVHTAAAVSTERYRNKKPLGPLDGVPVAVSVELDVAGHSRSPTLTAYTYSQDRSSDCVKKWQDAGAIVVGRLNMHELGMDISETSMTPSVGLTPDRKQRPTPPHPYNDRYYLGGTCGGSGVAIGLGLVTAILAGDAGGGVRVPAAYSGLYGLKPSRSTLSEMPGMTTTIMMGGQTGIIASNVEDLRLFYRAAAAREHRTTRLLPVFAAPRPPLAERKRILGICWPWFDRADEPIKQFCRNAIQHMQQHHNYAVVDISLPCLLEGQTIYAHHALTGLRAGVFCDSLSSSGPNDGLRGVANSNRAGGDDRPDKILNLYMLHVAAIFQQHPGLIIVTPTVPEAGWAIRPPGKTRKDLAEIGPRSVRNIEYAWFACFTALPSLSVPVGYIEPSVGEGVLPVGMMGTGEWGSEEELLEWGKDAEDWLLNGVPGGRQRPARWVDCIQRTLDAVDAAASRSS